MKRLKSQLTVITLALVGAFGIFPASAQTTTSSSDSGSPPAASDPSAAEMAKMMEMANPGPNHRLLSQLAGTWQCDVKFWMGGGPPSEAHGTAVRKAALGGRYFIMDTTTVMEMPGADGKIQKSQYKGISVEGYNNVKQKFQATWIDDLGTGILMGEGSYDPATKTISYHLEDEMTPGKKTKMRETVQIVDSDHYIVNWYEDRHGREAKTVEIDCTRQK